MHDVLLGWHFSDVFFVFAVIAVFCQKVCPDWKWVVMAVRGVQRAVLVVRVVFVGALPQN